MPVTVKVKVPLVDVPAEVRTQVPLVPVVAVTPVALVAPDQSPLTTAPATGLPVSGFTTVIVALEVKAPLAKALLMVSADTDATLGGGMMDAEVTVFMSAS